MTTANAPRPPARWPVTAALLALAAACSNNNVAVSATQVMQTFGSFDDGNDSPAADLTGSSSAGPGDTGTSSPDDTTADPDASSTSTGPGPADTTAADTTAADTTTADSSSSGSGDETTEGPLAPLQPPRYAVLDTCYGGYLRIADLDNAWALLPSDPLPDASGKINVGVSGEHIYQITVDTNTISRYGFDSHAWEPYILGPVAITTAGGFVEWVGDEKLCLGYVGRTEVHCHDGDEWRLIPLSGEASRYASWDRETNELYIKTRYIDGFQVLDLDTDQIVRTVSGQDSNEQLYNCTFDYHDGWVYFDDYPNAYRVNALTGDTDPLPIPTLNSPRGGGVNPFNGKFDLFTVKYAEVDQIIQEYDPQTNQLVTLPAPLLTVNPYRIVFQQKTAD